MQDVAESGRVTSNPGILVYTKQAGHCCSREIVPSLHLTKLPGGPTTRTTTHMRLASLGSLELFL